MDVKTILAAVPVIRRVWKFTPPALRVPLVVVGAGVAAWQWFQGREHPSVAEHAADVSADTSG